MMQDKGGKEEEEEKEKGRLYKYILRTSGYCTCTVHVLNTVIGTHTEIHIR